MIRKFGFLPVLILFLLGSHLLHERPPRWLMEDPLLHPLGMEVFESGREALADAHKDPQKLVLDQEHPLMLNRASPGQIQGLPGVGEVLAQRIVAHRDSLGGIHELEELQEVKGIGPRSIERWRGLIDLEE